jgi:hypothetical protein
MTKPIEIADFALKPGGTFTVIGSDVHRKRPRSIPVSLDLPGDTFVMRLPVRWYAACLHHGLRASKTALAIIVSAWAPKSREKREIRLTRYAAELVGLTPQAQYDGLKRLEAAGLIERVPTPKGRRAAVRLIPVAVDGGEE